MQQCVGTKRLNNTDLLNEYKKHRSIRSKTVFYIWLWITHSLASRWIRREQEHTNKTVCYPKIMKLNHPLQIILLKMKREMSLTAG